MFATLQNIDNVRKRIDAYRPVPEEILSVWQERLRIDWTYNSNAIEGNTLTYGETAFFLREGLTSEGKSLEEYLEVKNHAEAIDYLQEIVHSRRGMTERFIKELHGLLLRGIDHTVARGAHGKLIRKPLSAGAYKTRPNHVLTLSGTIHKYTEPIKVPDEMQTLLQWLTSTEAPDHPVERCALFHHRFVCIHPFDDGNGRMARLLMNLLLMKAGYPPCVVRHSKRKKYLNSLAHADATESTDMFVECIAHELLHTMQTMLDVLQGKALPAIAPVRLQSDERKALILASIGDQSLSISQIAKHVPHIKRPTLKKDLASLVQAKKLQKHGIGKGVTYSCYS